MREYGIPKVLTWRWTPFAACVLAALSFVGFATLVIPDRIGQTGSEASAASLQLGGDLVRAHLGAPASNNWSSDDAIANTATAPSPLSRVAARTPEAFPRRGFSPPLERVEPPPQPQLQAPPPAPVELAAPPPAPPPMSDRPEPQGAVPANPEPPAPPPAAAAAPAEPDSH